MPVLTSTLIRGTSLQCSNNDRMTQGFTGTKVEHLSVGEITEPSELPHPVRGGELRTGGPPGRGRDTHLRASTSCISALGSTSQQTQLGIDPSEVCRRC